MIGLCDLPGIGDTTELETLQQRIASVRYDFELDVKYMESYLSSALGFDANTDITTLNDSFCSNEWNEAEEDVMWFAGHRCDTPLGKDQVSPRCLNNKRIMVRPALQAHCLTPCPRAYQAQGCTRCVRAQSFENLLQQYTKRMHQSMWSRNRVPEAYSNKFEPLLVRVDKQDAAHATRFSYSKFAPRQQASRHFLHTGAAWLGVVPVPNDTHTDSWLSLEHLKHIKKIAGVAILSAERIHESAALAWRNLCIYDTRKPRVKFVTRILAWMMDRMLLNGPAPTTHDLYVYLAQFEHHHHSSVTRFRSSVMMPTSVASTASNSSASSVDDTACAPNEFREPWENDVPIDWMQCTLDQLHQRYGRPLVHDFVNEYQPVYCTWNLSQGYSRGMLCLPVANREDIIRQVQYVLPKLLEVKWGLVPFSQVTAEWRYAQLTLEGAPAAVERAFVQLKHLLVRSSSSNSL